MIYETKLPAAVYAAGSFFLQIIVDYSLNLCNNTK